MEFVHAFGAPAMLWQPEPDPRDVAAGRDPLALATHIVTAHVTKVVGAVNGRMKRTAELVRVVPGRPAEVILQRAKKQKSDLIVLGALRREPAVDFGGTARSILAGAPCPVWVQPGPRREIERILVPVDLSDESLLALATACDMARVFGASVTALHVFDLPKMTVVPWDGYGSVVDVEHMRTRSAVAFEQAMAKHDWKRVKHDVQFVDGSPSEEILKRAQKADLVAMGTHGRTGFSALLLGSVTYDVLKRTTRPVLAVRKPGRKFAA
jgi:nucleotide-binding universal stress UspA family protein